METKEILEAKITGLETKLQELNNELSTTRHELKTIGKPTMTKDVYELLEDTIRNSVSDIDFSTDNFDFELCMDYNNTVEVSSIDFNGRDDMFDDIIRHIDNDFRVIDNEGNITTAV